MILPEGNVYFWSAFIIYATLNFPFLSSADFKGGEAPLDILESGSLMYISFILLFAKVYFLYFFPVLSKRICSFDHKGAIILVHKVCAVLLHPELTYLVKIIYRARNFNIHLIALHLYQCYNRGFPCSDADIKEQLQQI